MISSTLLFVDLVVGHSMGVYKVVAITFLRTTWWPCWSDQPFEYTVMKLRPILATGDWFKLPEWSPIKVLDVEELAAKQAREEKLFARRALGKLNKEES